MLLIWKGWGLLALLIPAVFILLAVFIGDAIAGDTVVMGYVLGMGFCVSAIACFLLGRKLNDKSNDKELIDPKTGETYLHKKRHDLFWLPLQWWSVPMILVGVLFLYVGYAA